MWPTSCARPPGTWECDRGPVWEAFSTSVLTWVSQCLRRWGDDHTDGFLTAAWEIFTCLCNGGTLIIRGSKWEPALEQVYRISCGGKDHRLTVHRSMY